MLTSLARGILERGALCHVASMTATGPHLTPLVFALANDRIWVTTSRGSTKARSWRRDDRVGGLVRDGGGSVSFGGRVRWHDALEPRTWLRSALEGPLVTLASARFTRKNARFFAGYAVDARHVPLAWTPPGRVFAELRIERWARFEGVRLVETWGDWRSRGDGRRPVGRAAPRRSGSPLDELPEDLRASLPTEGDGALAVESSLGPVVVPAAWRRDGAGITATLPHGAGEVLSVTSRRRAALEIDRASSWRAREMVGAMLRGSIAPGPRARRASLEIDRVVWWRGWDSGTVAA